MRRHLTFASGNSTLAGTLDDAGGRTGLLIVSGGNEIRSGAFAGQQQLAGLIAAQGYTVFRFDRSGIGDSSGENQGFRGSASDIAAALAAFRAAAPQLTRIVAFGNCDAASALLLMGGTGCDGLILSNPWTIDDDASQEAPPAAIRARYAEKLKNPREMARLVSGGVSLAKLFRGLASALRPAPPPSSLARQMAEGLARFEGRCRILLAGRDRTAQAFLAAWQGPCTDMRHCPGASHAFVEPTASDWLLAQIIDFLQSEEAGKLDMG
jgi:exosortase A-associated hydrolase 1